MHTLCVIPMLSCSLVSSAQTLFLCLFVLVFGWMQQRIEAHEEGDSIAVLDGLVRISAPFTSETCLSTNSTVLAKVKTLVTKAIQ